MKCYKWYNFLIVAVLFANPAAHAQTLQSSNLPIVIINTHGATIRNEPKIEADMGIIYNGPGVRNNINDPYNNYNGKIGIEIRGSSSSMFPKKQYGFELRHVTGADSAVSLLGLPAEEDWILQALYNDKSLMRDVLAYKTGRDLGRYAPRTRYCEVILNGSYHGIYALIEKIKRDKNRVDINKLDPDEVSGSDLTGGYIIKIDKSDGNSGPGWNSLFPPPDRNGQQTITFQYEYPKYNEIVAQQKLYIQNYVNQFEQVLAGKDFKDPAEGYARYIDVDSFIDFFIANEISKNVDGYRLSTFLYKQKDSDGGKLFLGPIWDFNLSFGNANYCTSGTTDGFVLDFNKICPHDYYLIPFWWERLLQDKAFSQKVTERWLSLRNDKFKTVTLHAYVDSVAVQLNLEAQQRNFQRWPILGQYVWPNFFVGATFQSEVSWLKDWITKRVKWLDENIPNLVTATEEPGSGNQTSFSCFPNPFADQFEIEYQIQSPGDVQLVIYDLMGQEIEVSKTTHDKEGRYRQGAGMKLASGVYYYSATYNGKRISGGKVIKQ